jgi:site-specific recombinase XerD
LLDADLVVFLRVARPCSVAIISVFLKSAHPGRRICGVAEDEELELTLAVVRDLREGRPPASAEELEQFETDVLAGFVLARASAGLTDGTIRGDVSNLEQIRGWFGRALWEMEPADADAYFGRVLRTSPSGTRLARAAALVTYFEFLELRHKVEIHAMTGQVIECPIDEMNRPRGNKGARLRIPPTEEEMTRLFAGWSQELATCRKFAPTARNYTAARLMAGVGLRVNEARSLDLADIRWELGRFGKLHVRHGKGSRGSGPRQRMVPLINQAGRTLRWFIEDVWACFDDDHTRHDAPLFPSERTNADGSGRRVGYDALRGGVAAAAAQHLPDWTGRLTPHVLRHYCASQLYLDGVDLISIQEMLGHAWVATTMHYVNPRELQQMGEEMQVAC